MLDLRSSSGGGNAPAAATFVLEHLELSGGRRGIRVAGPAHVVVEDSLITGNQAVTGAGIFVQALSGEVELDLVRTAVTGNQTFSSSSGRSDGGGIFCVGNGLIRASNGTAFVNNTTVDQGRGGGLYLNGCNFEAQGQVTFLLNRAHKGGAIAATDSARATLVGDAEGTVTLRLNHAEERLGTSGQGGAVYLDLGADLQVRAARFEDNRALPEFGAEGGEGGGLYIDSAQANLSRTSAFCDQPCISLAGNRASRGAAASVVSGGLLDFRRSFIDANVGDLSIFEVDSLGVSSRLTLRQSFLTRNVAPRLFDLPNRSRLELLHSSIGGNPGLETVIDADGIADVQVRSSILFEPGAHLADLGESVVVEADCLVVSESALPNAIGVLEANPLFLDADEGDLHLAETSPAVDICPALSGFVTDIDFEAMPVDQDVVPDEGTPADAGADEVGFVAPVEPSVFSDGFESGDLSAWASTI